jgi:hypothetical protein
MLKISYFFVDNLIAFYRALASRAEGFSRRCLSCFLVRAHVVEELNVLSCSLQKILGLCYMLIVLALRWWLL